MAERPYLIDVSRLIWRAWRRLLPTGIDRVCLQYVAHFGPRAHAVVQRNGATFVLAPDASDRLFRLILDAPATRRSALVAFGATAWRRARRLPPRPGMIYLNVGHTGLDQTSLPKWIRRSQSRAVFLIHDMIPLTHPQYCRAGEPAKHKRRLVHALSSASGIIANSDLTLTEVATFAEANRLPLPPSIVAWISGSEPNRSPLPKQLDRPYFVVLGTIEGRKNHLLLLRIWQHLVAKLGSESPRLVIIGQRGWEAEAATSLLDHDVSLRDSIIELNHCGDDETAGWIRGARALLMPSFAEGFGLPIVEALQLGTPVIAADLPVYREIVGDMPTYLDPQDETGWIEQIDEFCSDDSPERKRQLEAVTSYDGPNWRDHFARVEQWLEKL
jgi:glycosyltransferase involved in cell wall biosynthesis